jgi:transposase
MEPKHKFFIDASEKAHITLVVTRGPLAGKTLRFLSYDGSSALAGMEIELTIYYEVLDNTTGAIVRAFRKGETPTLDETHHAACEIFVGYFQSIAGDDEEKPR